MRKSIRAHIVNIILPSVVISALTGIVTGALIFAFRVISENVIALSARIYAFAHTHAWGVPLVVAGAALAALLVSLCLTYSPRSRGGGIPTAVALMRGLITFRWLRNIIFVFVSALLSYLCGIPLGNDEGPAVQMGTAVGAGMSHTGGKKYRGWSRYLMTGGATAGFAVATCAPVSGVLFGLEEAHRRFSPLLLMSSTTGVLCGMGMLRLLCMLTGRTDLLSLFHFTLGEVLPLHQLWVAILIGLLCGAGAFLFALLTLKLRGLLHKIPHNVHPFFKVAPVFAVVALIGCFFYDQNVIGTGHHLIEVLVEHRQVWYLSLVLLLTRALLVILSSDVGATGGLFTPVLTLGALLGSMTAELLIAVGAIDERYFPLLVVLGMAAFFSASIRTPLTAAVFAIEVFSGFTNILPVFTAILVSFVMVETIGVKSINEIAIEREVHRAHRGKRRMMVDAELTVLPGSFAIGKEPRDILWPSFCHVLSVRKGNDTKDSYEGGAIRENDILRLNFTTYDPDATADELCAILGEQPIYEAASVLREGEAHDLAVSPRKTS